MAGNSFGHLFKLTTFGESHGEALGGIIDGCPAGLKIDLAMVQEDLARRKPGQSHIVTQRKEEDEVKFLSGIYEGMTTGAPIGFVIYNQNQKSKDYDHMQDAFRPSHADYTYETKYGIRDHRGGGRSSARETACRVVAGAVAKQILTQSGIKIFAYVSQVQNIRLEKKYSEIDPSAIEKNIVRCPDEQTAQQMIDLIEQVRKQGDTVGGIVTCVAKHVPAGLGEPCFDKLHADLGKAMLSINAVKGFEYGAGFDSIKQKGSEQNDLFVNRNGIRTLTNNSGGIQGGISNGEDIYFRVAFKPVATVMQKQKTVNKAGEEVILEGRGRHDPCVLPRAVPIVEAMTALVLVDHLLLNRAAKL
jgi:chorismate synthase